MYKQSHMCFLCSIFILVSDVFFFLICIFIPPEMHVREIIHAFLVFIFSY